MTRTHHDAEILGEADEHRLAHVLARFPDVPDDAGEFGVAVAEEVEDRRARVPGDDEPIDLTHLLDVDGHPRWVGFSEKRRLIVYGPPAGPDPRPGR